MSVKSLKPQELT